MFGRSRLAVLIGAALVSGCATLSPPKPAGEAISISVGPCFGFCPVYNVELQPTGEIRFEGVRHTEVIGVRQANSPDGYSRVATALARYRPDRGTTEATECDSNISDMPHYTITWTAADGTKSVLNHDRGCVAKANQRLNFMLETLPDVLGIQQWAKQVTRPGAGRG